MAVSRRRTRVLRLCWGREAVLDAEDEHVDERRGLGRVEVEAELLVGRVVGEGSEPADPVPARRRGQRPLHPGGLAPDLRGERGPGVPFAHPRVVLDVHLTSRGLRRGGTKEGGSVSEIRLE